MCVYVVALKEGTFKMPALNFASFASIPFFFFLVQKKNHEEHSFFFFFFFFLNKTKKKSLVLQAKN